MKGKFTAIMLIFTAVMGTAALAEESITARTEDNSVVFTKQIWMEDSVILSCYDTDKKLKYSNIYTSEDGEFKAEIPKEFFDMEIRAYFVNGQKIYGVDISKEPLATASPEAGQTPVPSVSPQPTETPAPTGTPAQASYPEVYKSAAAANTTFAVVSRVSKTIADGEDMYTLEVLHQGQEKSVNISADLRIVAASDNFSYMTGQDLSALKKGDVIVYSYNPSKTKVRDVSLVYRPLGEEIALSENDYGEGFSKLISENGMVAGRKAWSVKKSSYSNAEYQYAFGIVTDRSGLSLTLYPKSGESKNLLDIELDKNTIVYSCDMSDRNKLEVTGIAGIEKTFLPKSAYDEDDNVIFTSEYDYCYALVRLVDGTATDIIVYKN